MYLCIYDFVHIHTLTTDVCTHSGRCSWFLPEPRQLLFQDSLALISGLPCLIPLDTARLVCVLSVCLLCSLDFHPLIFLHVLHEFIGIQAQEQGMSSWCTTALCEKKFSLLWISWALAHSLLSSTLWLIVFTMSITMSAVLDCRGATGKGVLGGGGLSALPLWAWRCEGASFWSILPRRHTGKKCVTWSFLWRCVEHVILLHHIQTVMNMCVHVVCFLQCIQVSLLWIQSSSWVSEALLARKGDHSTLFSRIWDHSFAMCFFLHKKIQCTQKSTD